MTGPESKPESGPGDGPDNGPEAEPDGAPAAGPGEEAGEAGEVTGEEPPAEAAGGAVGGPPVRRVRRLRARRTAATAVVVVVVVLAAGALLYDVVAVRAGRRAGDWRVDLADDLATRHLDDLWVLLGAGGAVLIGGWLCWLAFAPGLRRWLPLRPAATSDAVIDRAGVGALLVVRARETPGVEATTVKISRRRARVLLVGDADPAAVQRSLAAELERIALARPLRLDVRTRSGPGADRAGKGAAQAGGGTTG
ncbi:DUF6286 domain-containing protein [Kitasatospora sp. NPDC057015]|uniref:DUF6286 domain-containing protein n=1 Tax=Kitasatospora sp. NPDC057015 TaxID=3346001 RepID=UPI00362EF6A9